MTKHKDEGRMPCTCCNDLAQAAAEFADASRADNYEDERKHRVRYLEILAKHITDHEPTAAPVSGDADELARARKFLKRWAFEHKWNWPNDEPKERAYDGSDVVSIVAALLRSRMERAEFNYGTSLAPHYIAEQIFFYVLMKGGEGNPLRSISNKWFCDLAAVRIRELLTPLPSAPDAEEKV